MDSLYLLLPVVFVVVGWVTEYLELYAIGGTFGFYAAYALIAEGSLTNQTMMLVVMYVMLSMAIFLRLVHESTTKAAEVKTK